jgi:hypothetical protein
MTSTANEGRYIAFTLTNPAAANHALPEHSWFLDTPGL